MSRCCTTTGKQEVQGGRFGMVAGLLSLLGLDLAEVELQLLALKVKTKMYYITSAAEQIEMRKNNLQNSVADLDRIRYFLPSGSRSVIIAQ